MQKTLASIGVLVAFTFTGPAQAQSTVAEVLEKGGKQVSKAEFLEMLPARLQQQWPNRQGEEELVLTADGKITGKGYHYASRSESPATGTWKVEDDGKVCTPKTFSAWNNSTNLCWYIYRVGAEYFGALKTEAESRVFKANAFSKM